MKKRARDVEEARRTSNRRLSLIQQSIRDKKQEDYEKGRRLKKVIYYCYDRWMKISSNNLGIWH